LTSASRDDILAVPAGNMPAGPLRIPYKLSWFDAHLWAYADERGLDPIWSEDFEHGRLYGRVRVENPFHSAAHEPQVR
jgi:predicted nucleic acid-binding protein